MKLTMDQNLNEALIGDTLLHNTTKNYSQTQLVQILKFSPNWTTEWQDAICHLVFANNDIAYNDAQKILADEGLQFNSSDDAGQKTYQLEFPFPSKKQGILMKNLVSQIPRNTKIAFKGGKINAVASLDIVKKILEVAGEVASGQSVADKIPELLNMYASEVDASSKSYAIDVSGNLDDILDLAQENDWSVGSIKLNTNDSVLDDTTIEVFKFIDKQINDISQFEQVLAKQRTCKLSFLLKILKNMKNAKSLNEFKDVEELESTINNSFDNAVGNGIPNASSIANPLARRRLKLFQDLEFYGGKVFSNSGWICGICYDREQNHIFGRYKPVVNPNTNEIDPICNLRDDELAELVAQKKITQEQAEDAVARRDNPGDNVVTQNEWNSYSCETYWCTTGCRSGICTWHPTDEKLQSNNFWSSYNATPSGTRNPYWVFMNLKTGVMFQYSRFVKNNEMRDYMMDENDRTTDGVSNTVYGEEALCPHMIDTYPDFKALFDEISPVTKESLSLINELKIDDDGALVIDRDPDTKTLPVAIKTVLSSTLCPNKIRVVCENCTSLFRHVNLAKVNEIDMTRVKKATAMFRNATLSRNLKIIGSKNCTSMDEMFAASRGLVDVKGLDTSSATTTAYMFNGVMTQNDLDLNIAGVFNLASCRNIRYMFADSPITRVQWKNTNQVEDAVDVISNCDRLKNVPDMKFDRIFTIKRITSANNPYDLVENPSQLFKSNIALLKSSSFDEIDEIASDIISFYSLNIKRRLQSNLVDGYLVIDSLGLASQLKNMMSRFNKIRIAMNMPSDSQSNSNFVQPFYGVQLNCDEIDMSGVECANNMFTGCDLRNVKKIVNTDNITNAACMFYEAKISNGFTIQLPRAQSITNIFNRLNTGLPKVFPIASFGMDLQTNVLDLSTVFGDSFMNNLTDEQREQAEKWHYKTFHLIVERQLQAIIDLKTGVVTIDIDSPTNANMIYKITHGDAKTQFIGCTTDGNVILFGTAITQIVVRGNKSIEAFNNLFFSMLLRRGKLNEGTVNIPPIHLDNVDDATYMIGTNPSSWEAVFYKIKSIGPITGFGSVTQAKWAFAGLQVMNGNITIDDIHNVKNGIGMFKNCELANGFIDVNLDLRNLETGNAMFHNARLKGGKLQLKSDNPNGSLQKAFMHAKFVEPLDLGDLKLNVEFAGFMFNDAGPIHVKSLDITADDASYVFAKVQFHGSKVVSSISLHGNKFSEAFKESVGIEQIGSLLIDAQNTSYAFAKSGIKSVCFTNITKKCAFIFNCFDQEFIRAYGCSTLDEWRALQKTISELQD